MHDYAQEVRQRAIHLDTSDTISSHSSKPLEVSNGCLGFVRERMLCDWYQPVHCSVWLEQRVVDRLRGLT